MARFETRTYKRGSRGLKSTIDVPFIYVPLDISRTAKYTNLRNNKLKPVEFRLLKLKEFQHCSESVFISLRCMLHDVWQLVILRHPVSEGLLLKKSLYRKHMALDQTSLGVLFPSQTQRRPPLKIITYHRFGRTYCLNLHGNKSYHPTMKMQQRVAF
jgi:hypothetical protein